MQTITSQNEKSKAAQRRVGRVSGFSLIEVMVSLMLFAISGIAIAISSINSMRLLKFVEVNHVASNLAIDKMEQIAALDASEITSSLNQTESALTAPGPRFTYSRQTTVTVNSDNSRTVKVQVSSNDAPIPTNVKMETTFALWE